MTTQDTPITISRGEFTTTYENNEFGIILATIRYHNRKWCLTCYYSPDDIIYTEWVTREAAENNGLSHAFEFTDTINSGGLATSAKDGTVATARSPMVSATQPA
jgi:hypothetical protein